MAWYLAFIAIVSILFYAAGVKRGIPPVRLTIVFLLGTGLALSLMLFFHLVRPQWGPHGATLDNHARHLEFQGVAVTIPVFGGAEGNVRITGDPIEDDASMRRAFRWYALPAGSYVDLNPVVRGGQVEGYQARAASSRTIVRLNGLCLNVAKQGWVPPGQSIRYELERLNAQGRVVKSLAWEMECGDGNIRLKGPGQSSFGPAVDLHRHYTLERALKKSNLTRLADEIGEFVQDRGEFLRRATFARKKSGDGSSSVALVGSPLTESAGDAVRLSGNRPTDSRNTSTQVGKAEKYVLTTHGELISADLILPRTVVSSAGQQTAEFLFDPPRSYPLPTRGTKLPNRLKLLSADLGMPFDGYLFDTGNEGEAFIQEFEFTQNDAGVRVFDPSGQPKVVPVNEPQRLGNGMVDALYAFVDPFTNADRPFLFPWALAVILLGALLLSIQLYRIWDEDEQVLELILPRVYLVYLVTTLSATLLSIRAIMAFRASILPPFEMESQEARSFEQTFGLAYWGLILGAVALYLGAFWVVRHMVTLYRIARVQPRGKKGEPERINAKDRFFEVVGRWVERLPGAKKEVAEIYLANTKRRPFDAIADLFLWVAFLGGIYYMLALSGPLKFLPSISSSIQPIIGMLVLWLIFSGLSQAYESEVPIIENPEQEKAPGKDIASYRKGRHYLSILAGFGRRLGQWAITTIGRLTICVLTVMAFDPGSFLLLFPFIFAIGIGSFLGKLTRKSSRIRRKVAPQESGEESMPLKRGRLGLALVIGILFVGLAVAPQTGRWLLSTSPITDNGLTSWAAKNTFSYRMLASNPDSAEEFLLSPSSGSAKFSSKKLLESLQQRWQTLAYVKGSGQGYFSAPFSEIGMTYGTTLSDAAYSVFLIGEHGKMSGWLTTLLLVLLAWVIFHLAWRASYSFEQKPNARSLYGIAGMLGFGAVYMSLANLWQVPFTGQNVPFLSLNSWSELGLNLLLVLSVYILVVYPHRRDDQGDIDYQEALSKPKNRFTWWALPGLIALGLVLLGVKLASLSSGAESPFRFSPESEKRLDQVATLVGNANQPPSDVSPYIQTAIRAADQPFSDSKLFLRNRQGGLEFNPTAILLTSPFDRSDGPKWRGRLMAQNTKSKIGLRVLGSSGIIRLQHNDNGKLTQSYRLVPGGRLPSYPVRGVDLRAYKKGTGKQLQTESFGGIFLRGDSVYVSWKRPDRKGLVISTAAPAGGSVNESKLAPGSIVSITSTSSRMERQRLTVLVEGGDEGELVATCWRNGKFARIYPQEGRLPLAASIASIADENVEQKNLKSDKDIQISLDIKLHDRLLDELESWCRSMGRPLRTGRRRGPELMFTGITVIDTFSGQIKALSSTLQADPDEPLQQTRSLFASDRETDIARRSSWLFQNRTIGSTVKPLTFAALATQFQGSPFDIAILRVNEQAAVMDGRYRRLGDLVLTRGREADGAPRASVDMDAYLRNSRTWPAVVTATIGLVSGNQDKEAQARELKALFSGGASNQISIGSRRVGFRPKQLPLINKNDNGQTVNPSLLADSALMQGIKEVYSPSVIPFNFNETEPFSNELEDAFLAPLKMSKSKRLDLKNMALPEPHYARTTDMQSFDGGLLRYMFGAGENRWNAVTMAVNGARLMTGRAVQPSLSMTKRKDAWPNLPAPLNNPEWRRQHLQTPLMNITTLGEPRVRQMVEQAGYRIAMKTGTVDDGMGDYAHESELLMFTIGPYREGSGFVPGKTVSGFLTIRSARQSDKSSMVRGGLFLRLLPGILEHLKSLN